MVSIHICPGFIKKERYILTGWKTYSIAAVPLRCSVRQSLFMIRSFGKIWWFFFPGQMSHGSHGSLCPISGKTNWNAWNNACFWSNMHTYIYICIYIYIIHIYIYMQSVWLQPYLWTILPLPCLVSILDLVSESLSIKIEWWIQFAFFGDSISWSAKFLRKNRCCPGTGRPVG